MQGACCLISLAWDLSIPGKFDNSVRFFVVARSLLRTVGERQALAFDFYVPVPVRLLEYKHIRLINRIVFWLIAVPLVMCGVMLLWPQKYSNLIFLKFKATLLDNG